MDVEIQGYISQDAATGLSAPNRRSQRFRLFHATEGPRGDDPKNDLVLVVRFFFICVVVGVSKPTQSGGALAVIQISSGLSMLEQVGFVEALYNTRRSDQDEVKLRHAPCPGQGCSEDMFFVCSSELLQCQIPTLGFAHPTKPCVLVFHAHASCLKSILSKPKILQIASAPC